MTSVLYVFPFAKIFNKTPSANSFIPANQHRTRSLSIIIHWRAEDAPPFLFINLIGLFRLKMVLSKHANSFMHSRHDQFGCIVCMQRTQNFRFEALFSISFLRCYFISVWCCHNILRCKIAFNTHIHENGEKQQRNLLLCILHTHIFEEKQWTRVDLTYFQFV